MHVARQEQIISKFFYILTIQFLSGSDLYADQSHRKKIIFENCCKS